MSYGTYRNSLYRTGFRPVGQTNAWAASQLNGMSMHDAVLSGSASFHPWTLEGLGQNHPFEPAGGWRLHGTGALGDVPTGSILTYRGQWQTSATMSASNILQAVAAALAADGLPVQQMQSDAGVLANTKFVGVAEQGVKFNVTLQIQVQGPGFSQPNDAAAIVNHEVYVATGLMPLASSIVSLQSPSDPGMSAPGDPSCAGGLPYDSNGNPCGAAGSPDLTTWVENNAVWIGAAILAAIVLPRVL